MARTLSRTDQRLARLGRWLAGRSRPTALEPTPTPAEPPGRMSHAERRHAAGLMRINHAGEVAAQGLYHGQALTARKPELTHQLLATAEEERAHLHWCATRLAELGESPSRLAPLWYGGAFAMGALAGLIGDRYSLGFLAETERQVAEHLDDHLRRLPEGDARSRAILQRMREDETRHGEAAMAAGGVPLPAPVPALMRRAAEVMKRTAYHF